MSKSANERRGAERHRLNCVAHWEGVLTRHPGEVVDISATGCFILTRDEVQPRELVRLEIRPAAGRLISLWGEIVYRVPEMGFAVQFTGTDEAEQESLARLLASLSEDEPAREGEPVAQTA